MSMNISKGNMYEFVTHTWNTIKGKCPHDCAYCYMKRWGNLKDTRLDRKELKTDLGSGNFIFVGSSCDMFAKEIPTEWIESTLAHCRAHDNKYLLQTKNPERFHKFDLDERFILGTTIESNRWFDEFGKSPHPQVRASSIRALKNRTFVTVEPVFDFDTLEFLNLLKYCDVSWVNVGADSGRNNIPEPTAEKIKYLINELQHILPEEVEIKKNMKRITS